MSGSRWNELTLITTCKGRLHHLRESLPLFLEQTFESKVDYRVVVVDYGCPDGAFDWCVANVDDPRLTVVRIEDDVEFFNLSRARNVGARLGGDGVLAFFDADILLPEDALCRGLRTMRDRRLDRLNHSDGRHADGRPRLNGQVLIRAAAFHALRGYDETMCHWGGDDIDLYDRSRARGQSHGVWNSGFRTVHHEDDERLRFVGVATREESLQRNHAARDNRVGGTVNPEGYGHTGRYELYPPGREDPLAAPVGPDHVPRVDGCVCRRPGWCDRHQSDKTAHWFTLCRTRTDYFRLWEEGRGPGQGRGGTKPRAIRPRNDHYRTIESWAPIEDAYRQGLADAPDDALFVEVGVWKGRSACFLGEAARRRGRPIRILAVDHFDADRAGLDPGRTSDLEGEFRRNVALQGLEDVEVVVADSLVAAERVPDESAHMVMIDASHDHGSVRDDVTAWYPRVRPGGWLAGHDWDFPGVRRAVTEFAAERQLTVELSADEKPCWMIRRPAIPGGRPLLSPRLFAPVFEPLRGRRWAYAALPGNVGDRMIRRATFQFLERFDVEYVEAGPNVPVDVDGWLVAGGGNMGSRYRKCQDIRRRILEHGLPVVVLPQSFTTVEHLPYERVHVRERASIAFRPDALLAPDLALGLRHDVTREPDLGEGMWLRNDSEGRFGGVASNGDPAERCETVREYLELAARHEHVVTDRLHFAIASLLCGRRTTLLPNTYHKNRSMYDTWLADLGCQWREEPWAT